MRKFIKQFVAEVKDAALQFEAEAYYDHIELNPIIKWFDAIIWTLQGYGRVLWCRIFDHNWEEEVIDVSSGQTCLTCTTCGESHYYMGG